MSPTFNEQYEDGDETKEQLKVRIQKAASREGRGGKKIGRHRSAKTSAFARVTHFATGP